ncbi:MAG: urease accessory protein UreF [Candidatus Obscuribacterales bacterium]|nr:urease accessory protein UreF [Steroidobacteraceae bacterium]
MLNGRNAIDQVRSDTKQFTLLRLCQLVSPALPIGAYHFSQGLEYAVHAEWIRNEQETGDWILGIARNAIGTLDLPVLLRLCDAWATQDDQTVHRWSQLLIAARETAELRAEERHMGKALAKVLVELELEAAREWIVRNDTSYAAMFSLAATLWFIDRNAAAQAYLWAWSENQVLAALKLLPIGQSAGQRILNRLVASIPTIVEHALTIDDEDIGLATPLHGMASSWHETQYSRLFRS